MGGLEDLDKHLATLEAGPETLAVLKDLHTQALTEPPYHIELREGDLRETLKTGLPEQIDFLLLDIWSALAMPTLAVVKPRLRKGALIVVDNIIASQTGYKELTEHLDNARNGFKTTTVPYQGGLRIAVYLGNH
ncbi:O-methyltransferase [Colletotrichum tofieldiae]|nr:O-methyltransferase [Colletotrichum tofieldiae]GKT90279.1 O-methyltransferase [Colletotrichum tofieldiae]